MMQSNLMSDIDVALSKVNVILSVIDVELSKCPDVQSRSPLLPRLGNILSKMESIVSKHLFDTSPDPNMSWDDTSHAVWYQDPDDEDEEVNFLMEESVEVGIIVEKKENEEKIEGKKDEVDKKKEDIKKEDDFGTRGNVEKKEILIGKDNHKEAEEDNHTKVEDEDIEEMSIAHRVKSRKMSKLIPSISFNCHYSDSESDPESISSSHSDEFEKAANDPFIDKIISVVRRIAPDLRYSQAKSDALRKKLMRKARRKVTRSVHPDLRCLWRHAEELGGPAVAPIQHASPYPRVDWTRVNQRNLANLPKPQRFPLHGCEPDPNFYEKKNVDLGGGIKIHRSDYEGYMPHPYGSLPGFRTQAGIIAPGSHGEVVSGYTWSTDDEAWVLHAHNDRPKEKAPIAGSRKAHKEDNKFEFKKKPKRKV